MSFPAYPAYKESGLDWLGHIPVGWSIKPLWTLFRRHKLTGFPDEQLLSVYRDYGVIQKSSRTDNFNKPSDDLSAYQLVQVGDLAINKMKAWQGSVGISTHKGIVSPAYHVYAPTHSESPQYLHHLFRCNEYIAGYLANSKGIRVNQWDLEPQQHSRMAVLVPSYQEQAQIANFLDHETARIDTLIQEQQRLIELLKEKRQAVISHAVTKGLDPTVPMKESGVEWLGKVPEHWTVHSLKRTVEGCVNGLWGEEPDGLNDLVVIRVADFERSSSTVGLNKLTYRSITPKEKLSRQLRRGDLLLEKSGGGEKSLVGCVVLFSHELDAITSNFVARMRPLVEFDSQFLCHAFGVLYQGRVNYPSVKQVTGIQNIDSEAYLQEPFCFPALCEQIEISQFLDFETSRIDVLIDQANTVVPLLKERRSALISAAVTGKIDVRGWQPPADALSPKEALESV